MDRLQYAVNPVAREYPGATPTNPDSLWHYSAYGLSIRSALRCPELAACAEGTPDVQIGWGQVARNLLTEAGTAPQRAEGDRFLLQFAGVARFLITAGREILIEPEAGGDESELRAYLFGSAFGALLHQRGLLVLHGSAVRTAQGAVVFVGPSGIGKSTLAASFQRHGHRVLVDDVCAIRGDAAGRPQVYPGIAQLKLWRDSARALDHDVTQLRPVLRKQDKYALRIADGYEPQPLPLRAVYLLDAQPDWPVTIIPLTYHWRFQVLVQNTYRFHYLRELALSAAHFRQIDALARSIPVKLLRRAVGPLRLDGMVEAVLRDLEREEQE